MDNFDQESGQQQYANDSGLNVFFSKIYGYMALAVFVSAIFLILLTPTGYKQEDHHTAGADCKHRPQQNV